MTAPRRVALRPPAVPVDQTLVTARQPPAMLMLPAVPVRFAVQDPPPAR